jgi:hypothetical protein
MQNKRLARYPNLPRYKYLRYEKSSKRTSAAEIQRKKRVLIYYILLANVVDKLEE